MSKEKPKFLAVHFDGDFLEHAAFVESEEEWALLTNLVSPGDHWNPVLIPIEIAAAALNLLTACEEIRSRAENERGDPRFLLRQIQEISHEIIIKVRSEP